VAETAFVSVARAGDMPPGTIHALTHEGLDFALANVDGTFHAIQGHCPHLQGPLGHGRLNGCVLSCPFHGWQFDVTTGMNEFDHAITIERYEVAVEDGEVCVALPRG
jgi:nitrite reductase/ring-hydroxylating ferredoxin subunit